MGCDVTRFQDGTFVITCSRSSRKKKLCVFCWDDGRRMTEAPFLCDYPAEGRTCDKPMCKSHRTSVGPERDYCPDHDLGKAF